MTVSQTRLRPLVGLKFCGLTTAEDFALAHKLGVDFCGINQVPGSVRYLPPEVAAKLSRNVGTRNVLIFRDPSIETVLQILHEISGVVAIQLHGRESVEFVQELKRMIPSTEVWKALPCSSNVNIQVVSSYQGVADLILFDSGPTSNSGSFGGDGLSFDWKVLNQIMEKPARWGLAGGIRIETLEDAIRTGAQLIDVASGIEMVRGQKSAKLMREFAERFRACVAER